MVTPAGLQSEIRAYRSPDDAELTFEVFQAAIRQTAAAVYRPDQVKAWAGPARSDLSSWDVARQGAYTLVAVVDDTVVGFTDLLPDGLVDMLFVHPRAGRRGVARTLLTAIKTEARTRGITELRTFASRSAQRTFKHVGFTLVTHRPDNVVRGVVVPNFEMRFRCEP